MPTIADYEDAVRRIARANVPDDATTVEEVERALSGANAPQVTRDVAQGVADALVTEERVIDAIEASGELPSEGELSAITDVADDYDLDGRVEAVEDAVRDRVATVEDVETAVRERQDQAASSGRPTFREDVEGAVDSVAERKELVGESADSVTAEKAREVGAPSKQAYEQARTQVITTADQVTPAEVLGEEEATAIDNIGESRANTPAQVIRDDEGEAVGLTGVATDEAGERMAAELGTEYVSLGEVKDSITLDQRAGEATLTLRGRRVGEVEVE
jgi:hypothetical protein